MFDKSFEYYDRIYREFKDYHAEAKKIDEIIKQKKPDAKSILDVACGTGEHAHILTEQYGYNVDGIDIEPAFVEIAQSKCTAGEFSVADMTDFDLGKEYDVVTCLFSAIGYVKTIENTTKAIGEFARHVRPGGIIIVEPWISKKDFEGVGNYHLKTVDAEDLKVARISYSEIIGNISRITFQYLIGADGKFAHEREVHELGLLTNEELAGCFEANGLEYDFDEIGLMDRGLFVAKQAG
ncbi:MAG: class I SAM-dependent methyltransferase [Pyrinomonadaceae bacterium]|nr:class I SAM-dependent methyltransferase [Pyrinomonadaceae bacterium]